MVLPAAGCGGGEAEDAETTTPSTTDPSNGTPTTDEGTSPTVTPRRGDGPEPSGRIAFYSFRDGNEEVYVMNPDGSEQVNLTNDPAADYEPDWSPDGEQIAFVSDREGGPHIYVMNADGTNVHPLTQGSGGYFSPRWSPDGRRIALSRNGTLMVMDADGSSLRTVMAPEPEETAALCRAGGFVGGWSPDNQHITYYSASVTRGIFQVCVIGVDGSEPEVIVSEPPGLHAEPVWSSDGRSLAYRSVRAENHDVYVIDLETREERRLTDDPYLDGEPEWSPDDQWIVFKSYREFPNSDIYIMRRDGSDVRRLTTDPDSDVYPVWAP